MGGHRHPGLQLAHALREQVDVERGRQPPAPSFHVKEPVVPKVIDVGDRDRDCNATPQLLDVDLRLEAMDPNRVDDLRVGSPDLR
jgi:hypothetical protein